MVKVKCRFGVLFTGLRVFIAEGEVFCIWRWWVDLSGAKGETKEVGTTLLHTIIARNNYCDLAQRSSCCRAELRYL